MVSAREIWRVYFRASTCNMHACVSAAHAALKLPNTRNNSSQQYSGTSEHDKKV